MKPWVALALLAQILGCLAHEASKSHVLSKPQLLPCDDPKTESVADVVVDYINRHHRHGYKYTLNRIKNVKVLRQKPLGELFFLQLDLLETECHVVNPVPAANCTVRNLFDNAVEGDCEVKMLHVNGTFKDLAAKCRSIPAVDFVNICGDCTLLSYLNDPGVVKAVNTALSKFNTENAYGFFFQLAEISRGIYTIFPRGVHVEFAIALTNCSKQEAHDHVEKCHVVTDKHSRLGFCKASIVERFFDPFDPEDDKPLHKLHYDCTVYEHQDGAAHIHLTEDHLEKNIPSPGYGHQILDLMHSHNDTSVSHESRSAKIPAPAVLRSEFLGPLKKPACPGKIHHFEV